MSIFQNIFQVKCLNHNSLLNVKFLNFPLYNLNRSCRRSEETFLTGILEPVSCWRQFMLLNWLDSDFSKVRVRISVNMSDSLQSQVRVKSIKKMPGQQDIASNFKVLCS